MVFCDVAVFAITRVFTREQRKQFDKFDPRSEHLSELYRYYSLE